MDIASLRVGTTLHYGTYVIREVLGRGGFGITYLAHDTKLDNGYNIGEFLADHIETNFGTAKHFSRSEYAARQSDHNDRHNVISTSRDYNWGSLKATPTSNGGVKLSYNSIFFMENIKDGDYLNRKFRLTTDVDINANCQITRYKEGTKKLDEW